MLRTAAKYALRALGHSLFPYRRDFGRSRSLSCHAWFSVFTLWREVLSNAVCVGISCTYVKARCPLSRSNLCFETWSLPGAGAHGRSWAVWTESSRAPCPSLPPQSEDC